MRDTGSPVMPRASSRRAGKRAVMRAGYGAMFILLLASAFEAYRIQQRASDQNQEIYRRYVRQQETLYRLRRILYLGGIHARDLFLSRRPNRVDVYRKELDALKSEAEETLKELDQLPPLRENTTELRKTTEEYLRLLSALTEWPESEHSRRGYGFIQDELVPRRNTAGEMARNWLMVSQRALEESTDEFRASRNTAATRLLLILASCLLVGGLVARLSLKHSEMLEQESARQFDEVARAKYELQQLSARLLEVQEEERKRLSRELHDEIGQTLTALRIEISHAHSSLSPDDEAARERLERARELAERTVRTVRDISLLLRPSLLDDLGLEPALQSLAEDFARRTNIPCDFHEEGLQESLPELVKTCVYRVAQEALNNIQKHAGAKTVRIDVRQTSSQLTVQVTDDGRGAGMNGPEDVRAGKLGILGMRERASMLGGSVSFQSTPGAGSTVLLRVPLRTDPEPAASFHEVHV
jgi:signal transduction histidine kinase